MAFDQPRPGLEYIRYARQRFHRTRRLAGRTNLPAFVAYATVFVMLFPIFLLMPSYRQQVHDDMEATP